MFNHHTGTMLRQHFDRQAGGQQLQTTRTATQNQRATDHQQRSTEQVASSTGTTSTTTGARARTNDRVFLSAEEERRSRAAILAGWHSDACMYYQDCFDRKITPGVQRDIANALVEGFSLDLLRAIMDETLCAPRPSWAYCLAILRRCERDGLRTLEDWKRDREAWASRKASNPALQYAQREYREEDFGEDFFFDVVAGKYAERKERDT